MEWLDSLSPIKLAGLGGAGNAIVLLACVAACLRLHQHRGSTTVFGTLIILASALMVLTDRLLRKGVEAERWTPAQLAALRRAVDNRLVKAARIVGLLVMFMINLFTPSGAGLFSIALFALCVIDWPAAATPPRTEPPPVDWTPVAPLQSQHWGERFTAFESNGLGESHRV